jgi:cell division septation protein DedD
LPKQNRSLVRDGRIQAPKKRTDRSYLRPSSGATEAVSVDDAEIDEAAEAAEAPIAVEASKHPTAAFAPPAPKPAAAPPAPASKLPTAVRAIQQQGVRKRRDVDLGALARRDTNYAYHELRRIGVLATMVVVTLVVLWFVLR